MAESGRVAVVTGGNRGIGFEVGRQLGRLGLTVILTARDPARLESAVAELRGEGLDVAGRPLDVRSESSVAELARHLREEVGRLDVLVNNAAVSLDEQPLLEAASEILAETLETNLHGPIRMARALVPLLRSGGYGRIVNVSSQLGSLANMGDGYAAYRISKAALNATTRILAAELSGTGILVNSACPGWVRTDMGGPNAPRTPVEGADTIVWLATLPDDGPTGGFFQDRRPLPW